MTNKAAERDQRLYDRGYDNGFTAGRAECARERDELRAENERLRAALGQVRDMAYRGVNQNDIYLAALNALAEDPTLAGRPTTHPQAKPPTPPN